MSSSPNDPTIPEPTFVSLTSLLIPGGLVAAVLCPPPSRRALVRSLRAAGVPRWQCNGRPYARGGAEPYFHRGAVLAWLATDTTTNP